MRFLNTAFLAALSLSTYVSANPVPDQQAADISIDSIATLSLSVNAAVDSVVDDLFTVAGLVKKAAGANVAIQAQLALQITSTISSIKTELSKEAKDLATGVPKLAFSLAAADIQILTNIINNVKAVAVATTATAVNTALQLQGAVKVAVDLAFKSAEVELINVITILLTFAAKVQAKTNDAATSLLALKTGLAALLKVSASLSADAGVSVLSIPGL